MAVKKAVKKGGGGAVSLRYADASMGGLPDDFSAEITGAKFGPWDYNGTREEHTLACILTMTPFPGQEYEDDIEQAYSIGSLEFFAPSQDGEEPVDLENGEGDDLFGSYLVPVGDKKALSKSSNFSTFMKSLEDSGFEGITSSLEDIIGVTAHFNRVAQKKRTGIVADETVEGEEKRERTILLVTELVDKPKGSKATASATKAKAKTEEVEEEEETEEEDEGAAVAKAVRAVLKKAKGNTLPKAKLPPQVAAMFDEKSEKAAVLKFLNDKKFINNIDGVTFDADEATFSRLILAHSYIL